MAAKSDKEPSIEDLGRREAEAEKEREERQKEFAKSAERLAKEVPERFFQLCAELKQVVSRFNEATDPNRRMTWRESAALAARDANLSGDFSCGFSRANVDVNVALNEMSRSGGRPNVYLIEVAGTLPRDQTFIMRVEGGMTGYRLWLDLSRVSWPLEELADRLVRTAVTGSYQVLQNA